MFTEHSCTAFNALLWLRATVLVVHVLNMSPHSVCFYFLTICISVSSPTLSDCHTSHFVFTHALQLSHSVQLSPLTLVQLSPISLCPAISPLCLTLSDCVSLTLSDCFWSHFDWQSSSRSVQLCLLSLCLTAPYHSFGMFLLSRCLTIPPFTLSNCHPTHSVQLTPL